MAFLNPIKEEQLHGIYTSICQNNKAYLQITIITESNGTELIASLYAAPNCELIVIIIFFQLATIQPENKKECSKPSK